MNRSKARESAFILIFESIFNPEYSFADMREFAAESELFEVNEFTEQLYTAAVTHTAELDEEIKKYLRSGFPSPRWLFCGWRLRS